MNKINANIKKVISIASFALAISVVTPSAWAMEPEDTINQEGGVVVSGGQPPNSGGVGGVTNSGEEGTIDPREAHCPAGSVYESGRGCVYYPS